MALGFILAGLLLVALVGLGARSAPAAASQSNAPGTPAPAAGGAPVNAGSDAATVRSAAARWNVPAGILWGVYGAETDFGKLVSTSSAGAVGGFQFTAADKGTGVLYPMTNAITPSVFAAQANAAAAYLSLLFHQHSGDWDAALRAYSGGDYGLSHVQTLASSNPI